jgi:hypothetical protein
MSASSLIDPTTGKIADRFISTSVDNVYCVKGTINVPNIDIFVGADFVPFFQIPIPANYQNAQLYRVSLSLAGTYTTANLNAEGFEMFASASPTVPGNGTPADTIVGTYPIWDSELNFPTGATNFGVNVVLTCRGLGVTPNINLFLSSFQAPFNPGTLSNLVGFYTIEAINA